MGGSRGRVMMALVACWLAGGLGGCGSSIWREAYRPSPLATTPESGVAAGIADAGEILMREAPWARVEAGLRDLEEREAASEVHISQWPEDQRLEAVGRLLSALQLEDDPAGVEVLGSSSFATMDTVRAGPELESQARRVGADTVIWSSRVVGMGTRVVDRPVHVHRHGWDRYYDRDDGVWRSAWDSGWGTAWVPVTVEAQRVAYVAFFLRRGL